MYFSLRIVLSSLKKINKLIDRTVNKLTCLSTDSIAKSTEVWISLTSSLEGCVPVKFSATYKTQHFSRVSGEIRTLDVCWEDWELSHSRLVEARSVWSFSDTPKVGAVRSLPSIVDTLKAETIILVQLGTPMKKVRIEVSDKINIGEVNTELIKMFLFHDRAFC